MCINPSRAIVTSACKQGGRKIEHFQHEPQFSNTLVDRGSKLKPMGRKGQPRKLATKSQLSHKNSKVQKMWEILISVFEYNYRAPYGPVVAALNFTVVNRFRALQLPKATYFFVVLFGAQNYAELFCDQLFNFCVAELLRSAGTTKQDKDFRQCKGDDSCCCDPDIYRGATLDD